MNDTLQPSNSGPAPAPARIKRPDEKYCSTCGQLINMRAEICPKCGVRQRKPLSKTALLLITLFLGGFGCHKFYVGKTGLGVVYLLFCWTYIPSLIALVEFFIYVFTDEESLQEKYPDFKGGSAGVIIAVVVGGFVAIFIFAIMAAVAIPLYIGYVNDARKAAVTTTLNAVYQGELAHFQEHGTYTDNLSALSTTVPQNTWFVFSVDDVTPNTFTARATVQKSFSSAGVGASVAIDQDGKKTASPALEDYLADWK